MPYQSLVLLLLVPVLESTPVLPDVEGVSGGHKGALIAHGLVVVLSRSVECCPLWCCVTADTA